MEYDNYQVGEKVISRQELNKAVQKIMNSLENNQKSYAIAKFILEKTIEKLDEICVIKGFE